MTPTPPPATSPLQYRFADNAGRVVTVDIAYNTTTRAIIAPGMTGNREVGCLYAAVEIGRDPDIKRFNIPTGAFTVSPAALSTQGFNTIDDVLTANFTLGF